MATKPTRTPKKAAEPALDRKVTTAEVCALYGLKPTALWNRAKRDPQFPKPTYIGVRSPRWSLTAMEEYERAKTLERAQRPAEAVKREKAAEAA